MKILCFGDSNTYGYDPRGYLGDRYATDDRWVDLLASKTGHEIINACVNGRMIPHTTPYLPEADLLLIMLGTNDLLQGASVQDTATRMEAFLTRLLPRNILLIAPPPMKRGAWVETDALVQRSIQLADAYQVVAKNLNVPFVDTRGWNIDLGFDGVHFAEAGHHAFAKLLQKEWL